MKRPVVFLAAFVILVIGQVGAAQSKRGGGSDKHGKWLLEVVTFPQSVHAGFKDLNKQALLYHPIEKPEGKTPLVILLHGAGGINKKDVSAFHGNRDVKWFMERADSKHLATILVPQSAGLWDPASLDKMRDL